MDKFEVPMDTNIHIHSITMHSCIAGLWAEVAIKCGIFVKTFDKSLATMVVTKGRGIDIHAAWGLFVEEHQRIIEGK